MNRILINIVCSYGYKLVSVNDKFSKPVKKYFK